MPSNRRSKDRDAEHQRWADRQEVTADVLRKSVEAAGARAAEISEWLDSSFLPDDPDSVFGAGGKTAAAPVPDMLMDLPEPTRPERPATTEAIPSGRVPSETGR